MSEYDSNEREIHEPAAFGQQLMLAREKAGMTLEEAARSLNLKQETVEAIEDSAMDRLPPVAFVQGYVRSYARLLGLPEARILKEFEEEVPHQIESELHPRPPSPDGANSQTPVVRLVSMLVVVLAVTVVLYALYSYFMERTENLDRASRAVDDTSMQELGASGADQAALEGDQEPLPGEPAAVDDQESLPEESPALTTDEVLDLSADAGVGVVTDSSTPQPAGEAEQPEAEPVAEFVDEEAESRADVEPIMPVPAPQPITGGDVLALSADQECWAEIVDANDIRLFYGMIRPGRDLELTGQTPFEVFLGNAPAVTASLNSIDIDMTKYIRSNNIAQFKISVEDGRVRFHQ